MLKPLLILLLCICHDFSGIQQNTISLAHKVIIPKEYSTTQVVRRIYKKSYEEGWWACTQKYIKNINYDYTSENPWNSGGPATVGGFSDGFIDADKRIKSCINKYSKEKVSKYLKTLNIPEKYKSE